MKPIVTWVLVANTREVSVFENRGVGKGLAELPGMRSVSETPDLPRDRPGMGHSIAGYNVAAVEQPDPQDKIDEQFASDAVAKLTRALTNHRFDRLVVAAGPHMLGLLRQQYNEPLSAVLIGEIDKDLTAQSVKAVASHVEDFIAL